VDTVIVADVVAGRLVDVDTDTGTTAGGAAPGRGSRDPRAMVK
jgi:hypothetical protein